MSTIACAACERPQPGDWAPGHLCVHCGGVVRADTRCAACAQVTPPGRYCRHCAAELVPDAWYGAARMLIEAGVDRLALAARVAALDPEQRAAFASRFARQRALVEQVVAIARAGEARLITSGHADALEDALVSRLPVAEPTLARWAAGAGGAAAASAGDAWLDATRTGPLDDEVGGLATLALLRAGDRRAVLIGQAQAMAHGEGPLALEAVVALIRAELLGTYRAIDGREVRRYLAIADGAAGERRDPARSWRVTRPIEVALARAVLRERTVEREAVRDALTEAGLVDELTVGLSSDDDVVRYGCAWLLADEAALAGLLTAPTVADGALRALAALASPRLVAHFEQLTDDDARAEVLAAWPSALDVAAFAAVVASLAGASEAWRDRVAARVTSTPFVAVNSASRDALARKLVATPPSIERVLGLLRWAVATDQPARPYR